MAEFAWQRAEANGAFPPGNWEAVAMLLRPVVWWGSGWLSVWGCTVSPVKEPV